MNILLADRLHDVWRKTGILQTCEYSEINALLAKWAAEEARQKQADKEWMDKQ